MSVKFLPRECEKYDENGVNTNDSETQYKHSLFRWWIKCISCAKLEDYQECSEYKWKSCVMILGGNDNLLWFLF